MSVKIKKIEIKINKKTIILSLEQARELKGALDDLFPVYPQPYYPVYPPYQPYYVGDYQWSYTTNNTEDDGTIYLNITAK